MNSTFRPLAAGLVALALASALSACSEKVDEGAGKPPANRSDARADDAEAPVVPGTPFTAATETPETIATMLTGGVCSVENVVTVPDETASPGDRPNTYKVARDKGYRMVGFAVNKDRGVVPQNVELLLSGIRSYKVPVATGRPRGDVAEYFKNPGFAKAGYMVDVAFSQVQPGDYAIYFIENDGDAKAVCATNQSISVL